MRPRLLPSLVIILLAIGVWGVWVYRSPDPIAQLPRFVQLRPSIYLREAIRTIRAHGIAPADQDWSDVQTRALQLAGAATSPADTYPAIRFVLAQTGDHSSLLMAPATTQPGPPGVYGLQVLFPEGIIASVYPASVAESAGLRAGDIVVNVNDKPLAESHDPRARGQLIDLPSPSLTMTVRRADLPARRVVMSVGPRQLLPADSHRIGNDIGYVSLPGTAGPAEFIDHIRSGVHEADAPSVCGWIVDLRRASAGSLGPMLQAVQPILGDEPLGYFVAGDGHRTAWTYTATGSSGASTGLVPLASPNPPVAVLTSRLTSSTGEAVAIAFRGRPRTRSFGEPTWGLPLATGTFTLIDGATLELATARDADRTGRVYDGPVVPDEPAPTDWASVGFPTDPTVIRAVVWLRAQCTSAREPVR